MSDKPEQAFWSRELVAHVFDVPVEMLPKSCTDGDLSQERFAEIRKAVGQATTSTAPTNTVYDGDFGGEYSAAAVKLAGDLMGPAQTEGPHVHQMPLLQDNGEPTLAGRSVGVLHRNTAVIRAVFDSPWAIIPEKLTAICEVVTKHADGLQAAREYIAAARSPVKRQNGSIAVIPIYGTIAQRMNLMSAFSGGTSTEKLAKSFREAMAYESVGSIVLDIDSPGGSVYGVDELAAEIRAARGRKPIVAVANSLAASAAYYIASQADEIVVTPSGEIGSIGVYAVHADESQAWEEAGVRWSFISAGKFKTEGNHLEPLGDDARAHMQSRVNDYYDAFIDAVAQGRGVKASAVRKGFGEGRVVGAKQAVALGMADRVATLDETITRLSGKGATVRKMKAETDSRERRMRRLTNTSHNAAADSSAERS